MQYTDGESTRLLINWGEKAIAAKLEDSFTCEQAAEVFQSITDELRKGWKWENYY